MTNHHHHHHHSEDADNAEFAEMLDLDAVVLQDYLADLTTWVVGQAGVMPRRILDLGSGTGTATVALAQLVDGADVIALDQSTDHLDRVTAKARDLGLAGRVHTVQADLDATWPPIDPVDLVWASLSLHHMADPDRVLAQLRDTIRPGGLLAVVEMRSFPRFLPDDIGGDLEDRLHDALAEHHAEEVPDLGSDWAARLTQAGFTIQAERTVDILVPSPSSAATGRLAWLFFRRFRSRLDEKLAADDLSTLDTLTGDGPGGLQERTDLTVRGNRQVWLARPA